MTRDGVTEKEVLQWSKELNKEGKLNNVNYVLNGLGNEHSHGYSYKYNYRYSYNYGYGYGYGEDTGERKSLSFLDLNLKVLSLFFKEAFFIFCDI